MSGSMDPRAGSAVPFASTLPRVGDLAPARWSRRLPQLLPPRFAALETGRNRLIVVALVLACAFAAIAIRLADLATDEPGARLARPRAAAAPVIRADLTDRHGVLLATALETTSVFANPQRIRDVERAVTSLAPILPDLSPAQLRRMLTSDRKFVWISRSISPRQHAEINRAGIPGIEFLTEQTRLYPQGALTAHVVGTTDVDMRGQSGIERSLNSVLGGSAKPVALAIDVRIQHILRDELQRSITDHRALGGNGIVLDTDTGEVIAMVSLPDFDPAAQLRADAAERFDRNAFGIYEQGSTFKIFNTALALDSGRVRLADRFDAREPITVGRFEIGDFHGKKRWLSLPEVFKYSSNIGSVRMAQQVGTELQRTYLGRFGLFAPPEIELQELGRPLIPNPWRPIHSMTVSFGHGIAVSPLQAIAGVAAVVNGGVFRQPTLLRRKSEGPATGQRVIGSDTSRILRKLMRLTVAEGTGRKADVPGYRVGGKTGTAEKNVNGRYVSDRVIASFIGAFPIDRPRYAFLVMVDEPKPLPSLPGQPANTATGGAVAAPLTAAVIGRAAPLLGVEAIDDADPALRAALSLGSLAPPAE